MTPRSAIASAALLLALASLTACSSGAAKEGGDRASAASPAGSASPPVTGSAALTTGVPGVRTTAVLKPAGALSAEELKEAAGQLSRRAAVLGLTGARFEVQDGAIRASAQGDVRERFGRLTQRGLLRFRPVLAVAPSTDGLPGGPVEGTVPPALQQRFDALDCAGQGAQPVPAAVPPSAPAEPIAACTGTAEHGVRYKLALGPAGLDGNQVAASKAVRSETGGWQVDLEFTGAGAKSFGDLTGALAAQASPANQFGIVLDDRVISHPAVLGAITGGRASISGSFTEGEASELAAQLAGPLPAPFTVTDLAVTTATP